MKRTDSKLAVRVVIALLLLISPQLLQAQQTASTAEIEIGKKSYGSNCNRQVL